MTASTFIWVSIDGVGRNKASSKWNVLNALEVLESTKIFDVRGTPLKELVAAGQCTIINLKGVSPDVQEIVVTRIASLLWEGRKRGEIPAHILVVEEAHNFCPERNVGNAVSGAMLRTVASEGRKFGMGLLIVSQRPAKVDKNVLSQCNTQVVLKVTNPNDLKAIIQSVEGISADLSDEIQRLPVGVALVAGGGLTQPVFVDIRPRVTRHGGRSVSVLHQDVEEDEPEPDLPVVRLPDPVPDGPAAGEEALADEPITLDGDEDAFDEDIAVPATPPRTPPPVQPLRAPREFEADPPVVPSTRSRAPRSAWDDALLDDELPSFPRTSASTKAAAPLAEADAPLRAPLRKAQPGRPDWDLTPMPAAPLPTVQAPPPRKSWPLTDAREIQRVATRVGAVPAGQDPQRSLDVLWELAREHHKDPDSQLRLYREVAVSACHEVPACIRCPLADHCAYNARLRQERHKSRNLLSRLWRS